MIDMTALNEISQRVSPVTPDDLPEYVKDQLARALIDAARAFYQDPDNVRKFEEWKARKAAEASA